MSTPAPQHSQPRPADDTPPFRYTARLADQIERRWQAHWDQHATFKQPGPGEPGFDASRLKFYCLDMFPYPSGAGLHVGHPEGYTATDIVCRFKRMKGHNVLHVMGWDAFGLPAEQYAIQTGVHPAITTRQSIETFRRQLKRFGFDYDWSREVGTIDEGYYRWTQWIFLRLYNSWLDPQAESPAYPDGKTRRGAARPIADLIAQLEGGDLRVGFDGELVHVGAAAGTSLIGGEPVGTRRWHELLRDERRAVIDNQRLAYIDEMTVNWCPMLGTVLANDEVIDGKSERGGHPVLRKPLRQWQLRITAYAQRLIDDLELIDWPGATKAMQAEWIGRSEGAEIEFGLDLDLDLGTPTLRVGSIDPKQRIADVAANPAIARSTRGFVPRDPYPEGEYGPVRDLIAKRRNLPHLNLPDATYFVSWRCLDGERLTAAECKIVLDALTHFDDQTARVYAACVMPDHVHWIVRPFAGTELSKLCENVKHFAATQINKGRGTKGRLWDPEAFDHIVRDSGYLAEFIEYVVKNPVEAGLVGMAEEYAYTFLHRDVVSPHAERGGTQEQSQDTLSVFTTRPDTIFGATYMVVAPEHPLIEGLLAMPHAERGGTQNQSQIQALRAYVSAAKNKSDVDRMAGAEKDKTGVFTGLYAVNPATGAKIPVWTADYVLMGYGTGAIMAVPAHDERDWAFAKKFDLPIVEVVKNPKGGSVQDAPFTGDGVAVNSANAEVSLDGKAVAEAKKTIIAWLESKNLGTGKVNFRLRDWVFSRQRYWGEPIPIVFDERGEAYPVGDAALPLKLPELADYTPVPSDEPQPLLAKATAWVNTTAGAAGVSPDVLPPETPVRRETNTMPGSAGSSWYFLRYCDPRNADRFISREADAYWMGAAAAGVDLYIGGSEHTVGHLLYSRFWHKVLFDLGEVGTPEPFAKLFHQGMITSYAYQRPDKSIVPMDEVREEPDGSFVEAKTGTKLSPIVTKMSKRYKNVINPDDVIAEFGADTFRLYEMYMGPLDASKPWNTKDTVGCHRFLQRAWRLSVDEQTGALRLADKADPAVEKQLHKTIAKVDADVPRLAFNTAIAAMMEFVNVATSAGGLTRAQLESFALILAPFAPHMAEELWSRLGHSGSLAHHAFPVADPSLAIDDTVEIPVQIAGKVRAKIMVAKDASKEAIQAAAMAEPKVAEFLAGKTIQKIVVVPGKMVNIVV